jgi:shikimate dehydrogenase
MQTAALAELGLGEEWSYEAIEVAPDAFEERVRAMAGEGFAGANVTVPHKGAALTVADELSGVVREVGAANTLVFADAEIRAENTDGRGLLNAMPESPAGRRALVLGAGGAARGVVWALVREGAEIEVWNRTERRSRDLCAELGGQPVVDPDPSGYELIVNSTAVGLHGEDPFGDLPLAADSFSPGQVVVDMVYGAGPTRLLQAATAGGAAVVDGIEILVQQGALSLAIWTGREPPIDVMRAAARG